MCAQESASREENTSTHVRVDRVADNRRDSAGDSVSHPLSPSPLPQPRPSHPCRPTPLVCEHIRVKLLIDARQFTHEKHTMTFAL